MYTSTAEETSSTTEYCRNGHERTEDNTHVYRDGERECRDCRRERRHTRRPGLYSLDVDEIAVDRAVTGDLNGTVLTLAERRQAVRQLTETGESAAQIAARIGCSERTVDRIRAYLRQEQPA